MSPELVETPPVPVTDTLVVPDAVNVPLLTVKPVATFAVSLQFELLLTCTLPELFVQRT
jgi:hypothetical protein